MKALKGFYGKDLDIPDIIRLIARYSKEYKNLIFTKLNKDQTFKDDFSFAWSNKNMHGEGKGVSNLLGYTFEDETMLVYHENYLLGSMSNSLKEKVAIISAGTSDKAVLNETKLTLDGLEIPSKEYLDYGINNFSELKQILDKKSPSKVVIAIQGFEGALAPVVASTTLKPIISVPTNTGYGLGGDGTSALMTSLNSCVSGITTVNINNGYGAAMAASRIVHGSNK